MFRRIILVLTIICSVLIPIGCSNVKSFYHENREMMKDIIEIVTDELLDHIMGEASLTVPNDEKNTTVPQGVAQGVSIVGYSQYREKIHTVLNDPSFWRLVDVQVFEYLQQKGRN